MNRKIFILFFSLFFSFEPYSFGQKSFNKTFSVLSRQYEDRIVFLKDSGYVVSVRNVATEDFTILKFDKCNVLQWSKKINDFWYGELISSSNGRIFIAYSTSNDRNAVVVKMDYDGNILFKKKYNHFNPTIINTIGEDGQGNFVVCGDMSLLTGKEIIFKIDNLGNLLWSKVLFRPQFSYGSALICSDGSILINRSSGIYKLNSDGELLWSNFYSFYGQIINPIEHIDGYLFAAFSHKSTSLFKIDKNGKLIWQTKAFNFSTISRVHQVPDNRILVSGTISDSVFSAGFPTIAYFDKDGNFIDHFSLSSQNPSLFAGANGFDVLNDKVVLTGYEAQRIGYFGNLFISSFRLNEPEYCNYAETEMVFTSFFKDTIIPIQTSLYDTSPLLTDLELDISNLNIQEVVNCITPVKPQITIYQYECEDLVSINIKEATCNDVIDWGDGTRQASMPFIHRYSASGDYRITYINNHFSSYADSTTILISYEKNYLNEELYIPNIFTPNDDGLNDYFEIKNSNMCFKYDLKIYNRWGNLVFQTNNLNDKWDGTCNGIKLSDGIYYYFLNWDQGKERNGLITILK